MIKKKTENLPKLHTEVGGWEIGCKNSLNIQNFVQQ